MTSFQGSGFTLELPENAIDGSSYVFLLPGGDGPSMPSVSVRVQRRRASVTLDDYIREMRPDDAGDGPAAFTVVAETLHDRGAWPYVVSVTEWGEGDQAIRRKEVFILIAGEVNTIYHLCGADLASSFAASEPAIDAVMRSFRPNDGQLLTNSLD